MKALLALWMAGLAAAAFAASVQRAYYVDPVAGNDLAAGTTAATAFRTVVRARDAVRSGNASMTGDICVYLRGGTHTLDTPLELDDRDSGTNGFTVRYAAYSNERPVLSGGRRVSGWVLHDAAKNIYRANIGAIETRQLFVNGVRAVRARSTVGLTASTYDNGVVGHTTTDLFLATWKNIPDLEMVYEAIWTKPRCGVASIASDGVTATVTMDQPGWKWVRNKGITSVGNPQYYENAYELLDTPGEWYLDRSGAIGGAPYTFYYMPRAGENLGTAEVIAPALEKLVVVRGRSISAPVKGLAFEGLGFAYTTWLRPSTTAGHPDAQNNVIRENTSGSLYTEFIADGAALTLRYASGARIERCEFTALGGAGLNAYAGVQDAVINGNLFSDISGTGIQLGDYYGYRDPVSENYAYLSDPARPALDRRLILRNNRVTNNLVTNCGVEYRSATGIALAFPEDSVVAHNEVSNLPYTGIHIGWGWVTMAQTGMGRNLIEGNRVKDIMRDLNDGGCIYFLGAQSTVENASVLRGNYLSGCSNQGLYFDEGSKFYYAEDHVMSSIGDQIVNVPGTNKSDLTVVRTYSTKNVGTYTAPRVYVDPAVVAVNGVWPDAALAIMRAAGLEPAYRSLRSAPVPGTACEAEAGTLSGGASLDFHAPGFFGAGFVTGFANSTTAGCTFPVAVASAGSYRLSFRYASVGGRTGLGLWVNGARLRGIVLPASGGDSAWTTKAEIVTLAAGSNLVQVRAEAAATDEVLLDQLVVTPAGWSGEAEAATLTGGAYSLAVTGASGGQMAAGFSNRAGARAIFDVPVDRAEPNRLTIGYSAGDGPVSNLALYVNGVKVRNVNLAATGAWTTIISAQATVTLNRGLNTIEFITETAAAVAPRLDYLRVNAGLTPAPVPSDTYRWSATETADELRWGDSANWRDDLSPPVGGAAGATLEFFTGQYLPAGSVSVRDERATPSAFTTLRLGGVSAGGTAVKIAGAGLMARASGTTGPKVESGAGAGLAYELTAPLALEAGTEFAVAAGEPLLLSGGVFGAGALIKTGAGELILSGVAGSRSGDTQVTAGRLTLRAATLADRGRVEVATGAALALEFAGADTVGTVVLGGVALPPGKYDASTHPAFLSGPGSLRVPTPFQRWQGERLPGASAEDSAAGADPDRDGRPNLLEYACGGNPAATDSAETIRMARGAAGLELRFRRDPAAADVTLTVEWSDAIDATEWSQAGVTLQDQGMTADGTGREMLAVVPLDGAARRFARVRATLASAP